MMEMSFANPQAVHLIWIWVVVCLFWSAFTFGFAQPNNPRQTIIIIMIQINFFELKNSISYPNSTQQLYLTWKK